MFFDDPFKRSLNLMLHQDEKSNESSTNDFIEFERYEGYDEGEGSHNVYCIFSWCFRRVKILHENSPHKRDTLGKIKYQLLDTIRDGVY